MNNCYMKKKKRRKRDLFQWHETRGCLDSLPGTAVVIPTTEVEVGRERQALAHHCTQTRKREKKLMFYKLSEKFSREKLRDLEDGRNADL